jgi:RNA polymerase-binding protein DksA
VQYEKIRKKLELQLSELTSRVQRIEKGFQQGRSADSEERSQENSGNEVRNALGIKDLKGIEQIRLALKRLNDGTYGKCSQCGEKISAKRLAAMPLATTCIDCTSEASL